MDENFRHNKNKYFVFGTHTHKPQDFQGDIFVFCSHDGADFEGIYFLNREMSISHRVAGDSSTPGYTALYFGKQFTTCSC